MKQNKKVELVRAEQHMNDWPPNDLIECTKWMNEKLELIHPDYRNTACIDFEIVHGYEDYLCIVLTIVYTRPETEEEEQERERAEARKEKMQQLKDLQLLKELKRKYE